MAISLHHAVSVQTATRQGRWNKLLGMLTGRRILIGMAAMAVALGLAFNWRWLTAIGVAPILVSTLPCVAMCALGLCMNKAGGASCHASLTEPNTNTAPAAESKSETPPSRALHG